MDLIISIKTGQIVLTIVFTIMAIIVLAIIGIVTYKKINKRSLF